MFLHFFPNVARSAGSSLLSLADTFAGAFLSWVGATWALSGGKPVNTPTPGSELCLTPDFATDTNWTKGTGWTIAAGTGLHAGIGAGDITQAVLTANIWYQAGYVLTGLSAGTVQALFGTTKGPARATNATFTETNLANGTTAGLSATAALVLTLDNVTYKALTLAQLLYTLLIGDKQGITATIDLNSVAGHHAGIMLALDSPTAPANGVLFRTDGVNAYIDQLVAGVYTNKLTSAITFVDGQTLTAKRDGTTYTLLYNGAQIGASQTITNAAIDHNTYLGLFSTAAANGLDNFTLSAR